MKRWFYIEDEMMNGNTAWDTFHGLYDTQAAALHEADAQWSHLTEREQKGRHVVILYADLPDEIERDEVMDYIFDNGLDGYWLKELKLEDCVCPHCGAEFVGSPSLWIGNDGWSWQIECPDCHEAI